MRTGLIYIATVNDKKSYIGYTMDFNRRQKEHHHENNDSAISRAIRKYGADAVEWRILEDDIPEERLCDREVLWIAFYDTYHNGYNMTEGGDANPMQSQEARDKSSETWIAKSARGENPTQDPVIAARMAKTNSEIMKAKGERGELPQQQPEGRARLRATHLRLAAEERLENWEESGQEFLTDMDLD